MTRIADSFTWPFRAGLSTWLAGVTAVLLLPIGFLPLLGYAVAATRAARDPAPPRWALSWRLLGDGFWVAVAVVLTMAPFALLYAAFARGLNPVAVVIVVSSLALPWGMLALLLLPPGTAAFAASGRPRDLFDARTNLRRVRSDFATWNVVVAAIVTAWALGLASVALLCVGIVPGLFYAILVSAHATAALQDSHRAAR